MSGSTVDARSLRLSLVSAFLAWIVYAAYEVVSEWSFWHSAGIDGQARSAFLSSLFTTILPRLALSGFVVFLGWLVVGIPYAALDRQKLRPRSAGIIGVGIAGGLMMALPIFVVTLRTEPPSLSDWLHPWAWFFPAEGFVIAVLAALFYRILNRPFLAGGRPSSPRPSK